MQFESINLSDLDELKDLQPPDWSDILPDISYYIRSPFCFPVKITLDKKITGIGAAIIYGTTAWLAHIIVREGYRNRGIGFGIVNELLSITKKYHIITCLLTATHMGKAVYLKAGFRSISDYIFMNREEPWKDRQVSVHVVDFREKYREPVYRLDRLVSGEDRKLLLSDFILDSKVYVMEDRLQGYCIPRLKEGPIIAENKEAGLELMKVKYHTSDKAVIPDENVAALDFLKANGFKATETKGTRMIIGRDLDWQPLKIFSRAGGNFG
jgi:GNAT superfamily N-acetyltransferase